MWRDWTLNENGVVNILGTGNMYDYGMTNDDCSPWLGNDNVNSVIINEGVEGIGAWAFGYCDNLRSVHISKNVNVIGEAAFIQCDNLTDVYYSGDKQEWNKIDIWSSNNDLWNASNRQFNVNTDLYFEGNSDILSSLNNSETITNTEQKPNSFILSNSMENESDVPMVSLWDNNGAVIKVDGSL